MAILVILSGAVDVALPATPCLRDPARMSAPALEWQSTRQVVVAGCVPVLACSALLSVPLCS